MTTWRDIPGYQGYYQVSDDGQVRSLSRTIPHAQKGQIHIQGQAIRQSRATNGYLSVVLNRANRKRTRHVHRLVAEAFLGDQRFHGALVCHNDGNPDNNQVANLRWDTGSANGLDAVRHGRNKLARRTRCANGHSFTSENTRVDKRPTGGAERRICRSCDRDRQRKYKVRKLAATAEASA